MNEFDKYQAGAQLIISQSDLYGSQLYGCQVIRRTPKFLWVEYCNQPYIFNLDGYQKGNRSYRLPYGGMQLLEPTDQNNDALTRSRWARKVRNLISQIEQKMELVRKQIKQRLSETSKDDLVETARILQETMDRLDGLGLKEEPK